MHVGEIPEFPKQTVKQDLQNAPEGLGNNKAVRLDPQPDLNTMEELVTHIDFDL